MIFITFLTLSLFLPLLSRPPLHPPSSSSVSLNTVQLLTKDTIKSPLANRKYRSSSYSSLSFIFSPSSPLRIQYEMLNLYLTRVNVQRYIHSASYIRVGDISLQHRPWVTLFVHGLSHQVFRSLFFFVFFLVYRICLCPRHRNCLCSLAEGRGGLVGPLISEQEERHTHKQTAKKFDPGPPRVAWVN